MNSLHLVEGDPVLIIGAKTTVGRAKILYPSDQKSDFCRIDGLMRNNAGISQGDKVTIEKTEFGDADHIVVKPLEAIPPIDERYLADALEGNAIREGDALMVPYFGGRLTFVVLSITPKMECVIVTQKTKFTIQEIIERIPVDETKNHAYVGRRIFSSLQDIKEIGNNSTDIQKNQLKAIWDNVYELLEHVQKNFPNNDFIPESMKSFDEIEKISDIHGTSQYLKSLLRKIADALDIKHLEILPRDTIVGTDIFIVHGHDEVIKEKTARFIEKLELTPVILHEQPNSGRTIIEKFEEYSSKIGFAVIILTPDDTAIIKTDDGKIIEEKRGRQNAILELGFFLGAIGRKRTCVLYQEGVKIPSDYDGVIYIKIDDNDAWKLSLAKEIKQSGIHVDLNNIL